MVGTIGIPAQAVQTAKSHAVRASNEKEISAARRASSVCADGVSSTATMACSTVRPFRNVDHGPGTRPRTTATFRDPSVDMIRYAGRPNVSYHV
jgi:hypothetical protein